MPAFNEEAAIARSLRSLLAVDYPADKLEIVAVDDGSTDNTLIELRGVEEEAAGRVRVISFVSNRGKRAAMAEGVRATDAEIIAFVDSDSVLEPDALRRLVQAFADREVGAVCGHADVFNVHHTWLTKMQAVRYYVAFRVCKAAESIFGAVTCCSGCFSAYRRAAIMPQLEWWEDQKFLGRPSTFGDDRSLTNCVLRDWRVVYHSEAIAHTDGWIGKSSGREKVGAEHRQVAGGEVARDTVRSRHSEVGELEQIVRHGNRLPGQCIADRATGESRGCSHA